jgi:SAM-dependent methyltransferase
MNPFTRLGWRFSERARNSRAQLFRKSFSIDSSTRILDIGSEDGSNIFNVLAGTEYNPTNVYIADVTETVVKGALQKYGFNAVAIDGQGFLPFDDKSFDIVYCSSVLEHVTVDSRDVWEIKEGRRFRSLAFEHQRQFADEVRRVAKQYFVQTPAVSFPIESHTWLPFAGYLPREALVPLMRVSNRWWLRISVPDFNLLGESDLRTLFPDAGIVRERAFGLTKSLMAIKSDLADNGLV